MKKVGVLIALLTMLLCVSLVSCKKPHTHNYVNGVCECGDVYEYTVKWLGFNGNVIKEEKVKHV